MGFKSKITNEIIDNKILIDNLPLKRLENFTQGNKKILFKCLICNENYPSKASDVLKGNKHYKCFKTTKLTNKDVDEKLLKNNPTIIRIGNYINIDTYIDFKCLICERVWPTSPYHLMNGRGCAQCSGNKKLTNEDVDLRLIQLNIPIIRIENINGTAQRLMWQCLICEDKFKAVPGYILKKKLEDDLMEYFGCANCAGNKKLTNEIVDKRLQKLDSKIKRLGTVDGTDELIFWCCNVCNYKWEARPDTIINDRSGCPSCHKSLGERTVHFILEKNHIKFECNYKIYISEIKLKNSRPKRIDFYLPDYNLFIEFNGIQHYQSMKFENYNFGDHDFQKQKERDENIKKYCNDYNIILFEIDSRNYKNTMYKSNKDHFINQLQSDILKFLSEIKIDE